MITVTSLVFSLTILALTVAAQQLRARLLRSFVRNRVTQAVLGGVAFLGAGAIIRAGKNVRGLTTGASLWMSGVIGVSCGGGYYVIGVMAAALALIVLSLLSLLERRIRASSVD